MRELEKEARKYTNKKHNIQNEKPLTVRQYLAGQALAGLLANSKGAIRTDIIKREAYEWADIMSEMTW